MNAARRRAAAGFSLIETVIASLILMVVALGVLPLFSRAMASNQSGAESTSLANMATAGAEELYQLPFDHERLTVPVGATELVTQEVWSRKLKRWIAPADLDTVHDLALWSRRTRVRQFNINDVLAGSPTPLDGGTASGVHVKEIEVEVSSPRAGGPLGRGRTLTVRLLKAQ